LADAVAAAPTVRDALGYATARLAAAGCDSPRLDAELLLAHVLRTDRARLVTRDREGLDPTELGQYEALIARRSECEPVAYILGRRAFRRITLCVDRRVLIPRPETELLVEVGLSLPSGTRVADVGTGSGAVALALKDERPDLDVVGIDISDAALAVARANAERLGLDVRFLRGDLLSAADSFDGALANLPYVEEGAPLPADVALYEPAGALFAGADGLDVIRRLIGMSDGVGTLALEVGDGQAARVASLLSAAAFPSVECLRDLAGVERVVVGRR
jgi:release factor glutamine methyltransferase